MVLYRIIFLVCGIFIACLVPPPPHPGGIKFVFISALSTRLQGFFLGTPLAWQHPITPHLPFFMRLPFLIATILFTQPFVLCFWSPFSPFCGSLTKLLTEALLSHPKFLVAAIIQFLPPVLGSISVQLGQSSSFNELHQFLYPLSHTHPFVPFRHLTIICVLLILALRVPFFRLGPRPSHQRLQLQAGDSWLSFHCLHEG